MHRGLTVRRVLAKGRSVQHAVQQGSAQALASLGKKSAALVRHGRQRAADGRSVPVRKVGIGRSVREKVEKIVRRIAVGTPLREDRSVELAGLLAHGAIVRSVHFARVPRVEIARIVLVPKAEIVRSGPVRRVGIGRIVPVPKAAIVHSDRDRKAATVHSDRDRKAEIARSVLDRLPAEIVRSGLVRKVGETARSVHVRKVEAIVRSGRVLRVAEIALTVPSLPAGAIVHFVRGVQLLTVGNAPRADARPLRDAPGRAERREAIVRGAVAVSVTARDHDRVGREASVQERREPPSRKLASRRLHRSSRPGPIARIDRRANPVRRMRHEYDAFRAHPSYCCR